MFAETECTSMRLVAFTATTSKQQSGGLQLHVGIWGGQLSGLPRCCTLP